MAHLGMDITVPFIEGESDCKYILVVIAYYSTYVEIFPLCKHCADILPDILLGEIFARYVSMVTLRLGFGI